MANWRQSNVAVAAASGAIDALRALPSSNGKVGVIGYCSGGRQSFLTAVSLPVDAAVDCYGAFVTGTIPEGWPLKVTTLVDKTGSLGCPLLGLFGAEDQFPTPDHVAELERLSEAYGVVTEKAETLAKKLRQAGDVQTPEGRRLAVRLAQVRRAAKSPRG